MNPMLKKWTILICICIACCFNHAIAQNGGSRDDLQKQAQTLQKELDATNDIIKNEKSLLQVEQDRLKEVQKINGQYSLFGDRFKVLTTYFK